MEVKLESSPRLLAIWNRPKLVWRIIHKQDRKNIVVNDNEINKFCQLKDIEVNLESSPRLLAIWNRPKLVWRIIHKKDRKNIFINNNEIKKIEEFIYKLSKLKKSSKVGLIVAKNIDHALHPTNNIKIENISITDQNDKLYASTRKFNLDKVPFTIILEKTKN